MVNDCEDCSDTEKEVSSTVCYLCGKPLCMEHTTQVKDEDGTTNLGYICKKCCGKASKGKKKK